MARATKDKANPATIPMSKNIFAALSNVRCISTEQSGVNIGFSKGERIICL